MPADKSHADNSRADTARAVTESNGRFPEVGEPLPEFSLPAAIPQPDGSIGEATLSSADFKGRPLVLFFYPKDATSGCTIEVCGFRNLYPKFEELGVAVVGVSRDTVRSHIRFIQNQNLPYPLLADNNQEIIRGWDLLVNKKMYGKPVTGVLRCTFIVDASGVVAQVYKKVTPVTHAPEVLEFVRSSLS